MSAGKAAGHGRNGSARAGLRRDGRRFFARRKAVLVRITAWSLVESAQTFLGGYCLAQALDRGFLAGKPGTGTAWLSLAALAILAGGPVARGVFTQLAALVEPFRDALVRRAVDQALHGAVTGRDGAGPSRGANGSGSAVSRVAQQSEIARDSFAGLVLTARSFVFTAVGALAGLFALAPELLVVTTPPLVLGIGLFLATLRPMAAAQRAFLDAEEEFTDRTRAAGAGLRDVVACGVQAEVGMRTAAAARAAERASGVLARWSAVRVLALGVAGQLPPVLLLLAVPWLLDRGLTAGALTGALTYLVQSLLPALHTLMTALGAAGTRLLVVLDRFTHAGEPDGPPAGDADSRSGTTGDTRDPSDVAVDAGDPSSTANGARAVSDAANNAGTPIAVAAGAGHPSNVASGTGCPSRAADRAVRPSGVVDGTGGSGGTGGTRSPSCTAHDAGSPRRVADGAGGPAVVPSPRSALPVRPALRPAPAAPPRAVAGVEASPAAELRGVSLAYGPGARPVLDGLHLTIGPREHLAVVGPSGIGKSTLTNVLAGLLPPDRGSVLLGGRCVRGRTPAALARLRALVPQEAYVFTASVRDNLAHLRPGVSDAEVTEAAAALHLGPLIARLGGLDALLAPGELSQGERQLLTLARAHLSPAPLLVLDEATCHLDQESEDRVERALAARPGALVVVAHRMSSALRADRVLVLDGIRADCGTHAELLERSALYRDLTGHWHDSGTHRATATDGTAAAS
ncbi:ABC transporter ATP-binding protein [Streptomyces sp. NPDC048442]|uniref:ABC transporter ATP-binding protein n=1 Tax=Streptomyces sp. NPDC048442 TaxID=3154823 RepID=UPI00341CA237